MITKPLTGLLGSVADNGIPRDYIAYYPFNGNANDESGNGYNGTVTGAALTTDRNGASNSAYLFDGNSDRITLNETNEFSLDVFSVSVWVTRAVTSSFHAIIENRDSGNDGWVLYLGVSEKVNIKFNAVNLTSNAAISLNTWTHLVAIADGSTLKIYIDNVLDINTAGYGTTMNENSAALIGIGLGGVGDYDGKIDDIRIYDRVLNSTEITALYNE